ncbi:hypothetical protein CLOM_g13858 [Closterium sp. NIES-68]|nr:hypothetical protein CLOM_g13858 [Closterium sp. NIES-68]GJP67411.1 hypothetical protein CLOP_g24231 [Closterium sp. NIES-67]GJP71049.1 hypothetical protein CLOP_g1918 [Closterium sp. NIES-67]
MHGGVRERGRRSSSRTLLIIDRERGDGEREEGERDKERDQEGRLRSGEAAASTSTATAIRSSAMGTARSEVGNARNNNSSSSSSSSNSSSMSPTPPLHVDSLPPWHQFISLCSSISSSYSPYSRSPVPSSLSPSSSFPLFLPHSSLPSTKACDWPASPLEAYVALSKLAAADWWKRVEVVLMTERGGEERGREGERERERERERGRGGARCREESLERINQVGKEEEREGCERGAAHNQQQQQQQQQRPPLSLLAIMCYKRGEEPDKEHRLTRRAAAHVASQGSLHAPTHLKTLLFSSVGGQGTQAAASPMHMGVQSLLRVLRRLTNRLLHLLGHYKGLLYAQVQVAHTRKTVQPRQTAQIALWISQGMRRLKSQCRCRVLVLVVAVMLWH